MNNFKQSVILMGIDWSKTAKLLASKDIKAEDEGLARIVDLLDRDIRRVVR